MVKITAEQVWNEIRDNDAHGISRYSADDSQGGFTYEQARDLGFIPPTELPEGPSQSLELVAEDSEEAIGVSAVASSVETTGAPVERFVKRDARIKRAHMAKAGRPLSQTDDAKRARKRRDDRNIRIAQNTANNADAWGR